MFPSTRYTLLREAASAGHALNAVVEMYWAPCYRYVMIRFRVSHDAAQDLVQGFFTAVVEREALSRYDAERGHFRMYLRTCLDQFVLNEIERTQAQKRGGGINVVPLDGADDTIACAKETPEELFHREWQREIFSLAAEDLRRFCQETGRAVRFDLFAAYDLADEPRPRYEDLAVEHGLPVTTVTNHLAWARRELRRMIEARVDRRDIRSLFDPA